MLHYVSYATIRSKLHACGRLLGLLCAACTVRCLAAFAYATPREASPTLVQDSDSHASTSRPAGAAPLTEPIDTDRPDFTESPETVPRGHFQLEDGFTFTLD